MELRWFYPIDWPQLSAWVRFGRSQGHGEIVHHLGDGRWFDEEHEIWRNGRRRRRNVAGRRGEDDGPRRHSKA